MVTTTPCKLGQTPVFPLALGCLGMSGMYGAALDAGITLLDTGDFYGAGHDEMLIGRALRDRRDRALISVKFGALRAPDGSWIGFDTRPVAIKNCLAYSLERLGVDHIDIYRPARLDPNVPIEETIGAIAELVKAGWVRAIGLSEVGPEWVLAKGQDIVPVIGARTRAQLADALAALAVELSPSEIAELEAALPAEAVAGTRYDAHQMKALDSER